MTIDRPPERQGDDGCPPPRDTDPDCDPQLIDDIACRASGVAAQAVYNATYEPLLEKAKTDYAVTRKGYRTTRHEAALQVQDMRQQIKHLIERIKCLIEQRRVWRCLDDAFGQIAEELRCCELPNGCCAGECEYTVDDESLTEAELLERITNYQRMTDEARECFTKLAGEPAALMARVAAAKKAIDAINAALGADPATTDLKLVYAQALVTNRDVERIWGGFEEIQDFVDCLCRALTCWTKGCAAVSVLKGAKAVAECKKKAEDARCENLRTHPVDEIMALYDKLCPRSGPCDDEHPGAPDDDDCDDHDHEHQHEHEHEHRHHHGHDDDPKGRPSQS
jgi:hypothetical protein